MVLFRFRRGEFDQIRGAARRDVFSRSRSRMGAAHLLQFFPGAFLGVELQILAGMHFLPIQTTLGVPAEYRHVNPDRFIVGVQHDHTPLNGSGLAHIPPFKPLLKRFNGQRSGSHTGNQRQGCEGDVGTDHVDPVQCRLLGDGVVVPLVAEALLGDLELEVLAHLEAAEHAPHAQADQRFAAQ